MFAPPDEKANPSLQAPSHEARAGAFGSQFATAAEKAKSDAREQYHSGARNDVSDCNRKPPVSVTPKRAVCLEQLQEPLGTRCHGVACGSLGDTGAVGPLALMV